MQHEARTFAPDEVKQFHRNPRKGNLSLIKDSLEASGQYRPIVVNKGTHTGRENEVLVGNHTARAILELGRENPNDTRWASITAYVIDVDDEAANRIVLADNKTSDNATYDQETLLGLLESVDHDLDGTGYDYDELDELMDAATPTETAAGTGDAHLADDGDGRGTYVQGEGLVRPGGQTRTMGTYHEQPTRAMILSYTVSEHTRVSQLFRDYHTTHPETGGSHAEIIIRLLEEYTGDTAPTVNEEDTEE